MSFPVPALLEGRKGGGIRIPDQPPGTSLGSIQGDWSPLGGQDPDHLARSPRPSWALPTQRGTRANAAPWVSPARCRTRAGPGLAPHSGKPGSRSSPSAHLARLVELLLQPRHRHSAFRRRTSRWDPANRRNSASDRLPGAAEPPRASAGPVGTASAAFTPAPRRPGAASAPLAPARPGYYMATAHFRRRPGRSARTHPAGRTAHAHFACLGSVRFCQRVDRGESRAARAAAATPRSREVALPNALGKVLKLFWRGWGN